MTAPVPVTPTEAAERILSRHVQAPGTDRCGYCWEGPRRGPSTRVGNAYFWPCPDAADARALLAALPAEPAADARHVCPYCGLTAAHAEPAADARLAAEREALVLLPALWRAHEYLRRTDAPDHNKVANALRILDDALLRWEELNPLPDDDDQLAPQPAGEDQRLHTDACMAVESLCFGECLGPTPTDDRTQP